MNSSPPVEISKLFDSLKEYGDEEVLELKSVKYILKLKEEMEESKQSSTTRSIFIYFGILFSMLSFYIYCYTDAIDLKSGCAVILPQVFSDQFRPMIHDCTTLCGNMTTTVDRVSNLDPELFLSKYAYTSRPLVVTDATTDWSALESFDFDFFKQMYANDSAVFDPHLSQGCQFFPYKTNFTSLADVFTMNSDRANLKSGELPWYIGWSNCDALAANHLRQHYAVPYFIPQESESSKTDWIFMGSPNFGAPIHLDHVSKPSWQAQITGRKQWTIKPPPECYFQCNSEYKFVVNPGEIVVLDTNSWFHGTLILPGDMSIAIGSEFD